ncbi:MAG: hypothetical protein KME11_19570 [Timaviella obliquedivisa GSE-PSE-MK23-08B]|nr:hypothetical protein [Timaviella obliquedivisa GSE-PSE-MK23-08B]
MRVDKSLQVLDRIASTRNSIVEAAIALCRLTIALSEEQWHCVGLRSHCRAHNWMLSGDNGIVKSAIALSGLQHRYT